ncbi:U-box domain-containing protein 15-like [Nymphaea colorata]|nr:U-box domain-containing protein 15-like [Nymphaea colorata]
MDEKASEREAQEPQRSEAEDKDIIQSLFEIEEAICAFGDYRRAHRKECFNLVRRIKLLGPLLEEVRENEAPLSEKSVACFGNLKKAFICAKKLLKTCHNGSKIYLALDSEGIAARFRSVYEKLNRALETIPYEELGISDEVKEQVELMHSQLKRSKRRTETQDIELAMDMMLVFSKKDDRNADSAILERLANKLELHTIPELQEETNAVKQLVKEGGGWPSPEMIQQIMDVLNKFKQIAGVKETSGSMEETKDASPPNKCLQKCQSLSIPNDFLCPITLEIMSDPVIVATGQTYERTSIQQWLDSGHRTCPTTRQPLAHLSLAPNYALRNLITHWCEMYNVELPKREADTSTGSASQQTQEISTIVQNLSSNQLEVQRSAVIEIRKLSKENPDNRILIAKSGGIPSLINLLSYPDSRIQENAVTALLNLSIDETNKRIIAKEEAIPAIIEVLKHGSVGARENSAATLFSLSMVDDNKVAIGSLNGIPPLVDLLQNGTVRGKKDAATALFNLSLNQMNRGRAVKAGITKPLLQLVTDKQLGMVDEALSILFLLSSSPEGRSEIGQISFIQTLVELIKEGTPKNKECASAVLLELAANHSPHLLAALQFGVYEHLLELAKNGTNRAQRKAQSLLHYMSKCEQIP